MSIKDNIQDSSNSTKGLIASGVLIAVALVFLVIGLAAQSHYKEILEFPKLDAEVTQIFEREHIDEDDVVEKVYTAHISYTIGGETYTRAYSFNSDPGETITIIYNPKKPGEAYLASDPPKKSDMFYMAGIFGGIGLIVLISSLLDRKQNG